MGTLAGKQVLVVEDGYFIATNLKQLLEESGAIVVGPVGNLAQGLALAEEPLDAAVLDVSLRGTPSFPIADRLSNRNVPYVFLTGYDEWSLPSEYRDTARLAKPLPSTAIVTMVGTLLSEERVP